MRIQFLFALSFLLVIGCSNASTESGNSSTAIPVASNETPKFDGNPDRIFQTKNLQKIKVKTKSTELDLWVMDTEDKRREGMMFLTEKEVEDKEGMIFVFREAQQADGNRGFWMQHTILPLDIAYLDANKKVINVGAGKPLSEDMVRAGGDFKYVIEVKAGLALKYGLSPGSKVEIPDTLIAKD